MERRILPTRTIELRESENGNRLTGYGAVFYRDGDPSTEFELWEGVVERIMPGAFDKAVSEDDVRGMYNHRELLARTSSGTMRLSIDDVGLRYDIDIPNTTLGRDLTEHIRRGDVNGSSFAFNITDETWRKEDNINIREIRGVRLFDTGPVDFPAYEGTSAGIRAVGDVDEARKAFEARQNADKLLRDKVMTRARLVQLGI